MDEEVIRIKRLKVLIVFIGYIALVIANIVVWIEYFIHNEVALVFPILFSVIGLGFTTPIIMKVLRRDYYLVLSKEGFINNTGFNHSGFISWENVEAIHYINNLITIDLKNHFEFLSNTSFLNRIVSKVNKSTIALVSWYLEVHPHLIIRKMDKFAYTYCYNNLVFDNSDNLSLIGVYSTPFLGGDVSLVEIELKSEDIDKFLNQTYLLSTINRMNNQAPFSEIILTEGRTRKRVLFFICFVEKDRALITPLGNLKIDQVQKLPDRLKDIVDYKSLDIKFPLYADAKPLYKPDIDGEGTGFVEFTGKVFVRKEIHSSWGEDSIYFDVDFFEFLIFFVPQNIDFKIYSWHSFSKDESYRYISIMKTYILNANNINSFEEFITQLDIDSSNFLQGSIRYIDDFMSYKEVITSTLSKIIVFIEENDYEFTILGI